MHSPVLYLAPVVGVVLLCPALVLSQVGRAVTTHVDGRNREVLVEVPAKSPAVTLVANDGHTITVDVAGPIRALRRLPGLMD